MKKPSTTEIIGWREMIALPDLGIGSMRAKIDTGARTSALHATRQERFERDGNPWVRFRVPVSGKAGKVVHEAEIVDIRKVKNTGGIPESRIMIATTLLLGRHKWQIETSLADRANMEFDMILGRTAIRRHGVLVDSGRSYLSALPKKK